MNTVVIFYSYTGKTEAIARRIAEEQSAGIIQIKDVRRPGKLKAFLAGTIAAGRGKAWPIMPIDTELDTYDIFILMSPIWAGFPAPAFNALINILPENKSVAIKMISSSGKSKCAERLEKVINAKGGTLESFEDIKA